MTIVHVVVPEGIDDSQRPSGGNVYDRRVCCGLIALGWSVHEHVIAGQWPNADRIGLDCLTEALAEVPSGGLVLLDGLIASAVPEVLRTEADRLRLVVLVHMPLGANAPAETAQQVRARECEALSSADALVTTSRWTRQWLLETYGLPGDRVVVAHPGVDPARLAPGTATGGQLLCVAAVTPTKGHDILLSALTRVKDLAWQCICVGSVDLDPPYVAGLRAEAQRSGIADRIQFTGPVTRVQLDDAYVRADALVLPSRAETYGMVITEGLARGLPVIGTNVGGVPEAVGSTVDGMSPGLLVAPEKPTAFAAALRCWLVDEERRERLREAALQRRQTLIGWDETVRRLARWLTDVTEGEGQAAPTGVLHTGCRPADAGVFR